jgi:hypothetical protein
MKSVMLYLEPRFYPYLEKDEIKNQLLIYLRDLNRTLIRDLKSINQIKGLPRGIIRTLSRGLRREHSKGFSR